MPFSKHLQTTDRNFINHITNREQMLGVVSVNYRTCSILEKDSSTQYMLSFRSGDVTLFWSTSFLWLTANCSYLAKTWFT